MRIQNMNDSTDSMNFCPLIVNKTDPKELNDLH
jgi:hypothetical protein